MKKTIGFPVLFFAALSLITAGSNAQSTANPVPAVPSSPADTGATEKTFKPHLENELELSGASQQGGQNINTLSYNGTYQFTESGNFLSGGVNASTQKVEGVVSKTGSLVIGAGLGLGSFSPSLTVNLGGGEQGWRQVSGDLNLGLQIWEPFSVNLSLGGTEATHLSPAADLIPSLSLPGQALIETPGVNSSLGFIFVPWDWWSISATLGSQLEGTNITYLNIKKYALNDPERTTTLTLSLDFTLFKGFVLGLSPQVGQEYLPAGLAYSVETGGLVYNSVSNTQNFAGGTLSASYSFE